METSVILSLIAVLGTFMNSCVLMIGKKECYSKCCRVVNDSQGTHEHTQKKSKDTIDEFTFSDDYFD